MKPVSCPDRPSEAPLSVDVTGSAHLPTGLRSRIPASWIGMSGYLAAGVFLGLVLILALTLGRGGDAAASTNVEGNIITDNVVHLHAAEIGESCWRGVDMGGPARLTVSMEIGIDGKVRYAAASGASHEMRGCVETHVKAWEFLPQANASTMALPFEIDRR